MIFAIYGNIFLICFSKHTNNASLTISLSRRAPFPLRRFALWQDLHQERRIDATQADTQRDPTARLQRVWQEIRKKRSPQEAHQDPHGAIQ